MRFKRHEVTVLTRGQETELTMGPKFAGMMAGENERESLFATERQRRAAWKLHGERLCRIRAEEIPGSRPWAFWRYEAKRPDRQDVDLSDGNSGALHDDAEAESVGFLAAGGYLYPEEIAALRDEAKDAQARIDTDSELVTTGMGEWHGPDRRAVKIGAAIEAAL